MKDYKFIILLFTILILITFFNFFNIVQKKEKIILKLKNQIISLDNKNKYLSKCLIYRNLFNEKNIPHLQKKNYVIIIPKDLCSICVEKCLNYLYKNDVCKKSIVIVNDSLKIDLIHALNDAYLLGIDSLLDTSQIPEISTNIIICRLDQGEVKSVLEYNPEEEKFFEEYFNLIHQKNSEFP